MGSGEFLGRIILEFDMSNFDPYLKWLGIRENSRPINHYRLLGLDLFEGDVDVIAMAADRQMAHIRTYQSGPNGDLSQQILNELARARRCLLMPDKKREYDGELRLAQRLLIPMAAVPPAIPPELCYPNPEAAHEATITVVAPAVIPGSRDMRSGVPISGEDADAIDIQAGTQSLADAKKKEFKKLLVMGLAWLSGGVAAVGVGAALLSSGVLGPQGEVSEVEVGDESPVAEAKLPAPPELPASPELIDGGVNTPKVGEPDGSGVPDEALVDSGSVEVKPPNEPSITEPVLPQYTLKNLAAYPKQVPSLMGVFGEAKRCIVEKKTARLGPPPLSTDEVIEVIPDGGAIVIGLALTTDEKDNVLSICPVYHTGFRAFAREAFGRGGKETAASSAGDSVLFLAKPGYALSGVELSEAVPFQSFRVNFMKISGNALDPKDTYSSRWVGGESESKQIVGNTKGLPVVGLSASFDPSGSLSRLSLIVMNANANPVSEDKESSLANDGLPGFFDGGPEMTGTEGSNENLDGEEVVETLVKLPRPDNRERAKARKKIAGLLQVIESGARTASARRSAARELISDALTEDDFDVRYVLWMRAVELGEDAGDASAVVDAMRLLDQYYEIDFWKETLDSIDSAARNPSSQTARDFKRTTDELIKEAEDGGRYEVAGKYLSFAIRQSKKVKDIESLNEYQAIEKRVKKFRDLTVRNQKSLAILAESPADLQANLDRGDFVFVIENDFENALPYWQKSGDIELLSMLDWQARLGGKSRGEILPLADVLAKLGDSARSPRDRKFLDRAMVIYKKSVRSLSGLEKQSVNQKIDEIKQKLEIK